MTRALRALRAGADLIAMPRNRWFPGEHGPVVDIQCIPRGLHHPWLRVWRAFSQLAGVRALGLDPADVVMVGDDPEADIVGAAEAGLATVWVGRAGTWSERLPVRPDRVIQSIAEL